MSFNQFGFLFVFLPVFLLVYFWTPKKYREIVLAVGSLVFYIVGAWSKPWFILFLLGYVLLAWVLGLYAAGKKIYMISGVAAMFGILLYFKYAGLFGANVILPLGISFYCFQMTAYLVDVYRGIIPAEKDPVRFAASSLMFPKLLSGPLMEPEDVAKQMQNPRVSLTQLDLGLRDFILGLAMKTLLADRIGSLWTQTGNLGYESISMPMAWFGLIAYALQLYFDFCGYSWMAIGLGRMIGFKLPRNFDHPYASTSIREFWRRWHITLGAWFKRYVYIPLGGSRNGEKRLIISTMAVWLFTGMWHGSTINFVLWGLILGGLILLERFWLGKYLDRSPILGHIYTPVVTLFTWLPFALGTLKEVGIYFTRLFAVTTLASANDFSRYGKSYVVLILVGILFATPYPEKLWNRIKTSIIGTVVLVVLFWVSVYCLSISANDPFMYFSF